MQMLPIDEGEISPEYQATVAHNIDLQLERGHIDLAKAIELASDARHFELVNELRVRRGVVVHQPVRYGDLTRKKKMRPQRTARKPRPRPRAVLPSLKALGNFLMNTTA